MLERFQGFFIAIVVDRLFQIFDFWENETIFYAELRNECADTIVIAKHAAVFQSPEIFAIDGGENSAVEGSGENEFGVVHEIEIDTGVFVFGENEAVFFETFDVILFGVENNDWEMIFFGDLIDEFVEIFHVAGSVIENEFFGSFDFLLKLGISGSIKEKRGIQNDRNGFSGEIFNPLSSVVFADGKIVKSV